MNKLKQLLTMIAYSCGGLVLLGFFLIPVYLRKLNSIPIN